MAPDVVLFPGEGGDLERDGAVGETGSTPSLRAAIRREPRRYTGGKNSGSAGWPATDEFEVVCDAITGHNTAVMADTAPERTPVDHFRASSSTIVHKAAVTHRGMGAGRCSIHDSRLNA